MSKNKEDLINKITYRASYRGTKEMDILMINFVKSMINGLDIEKLKKLDKFVNMGDEELISIRNNNNKIESLESDMMEIIKLFREYKV